MFFIDDLEMTLIQLSLFYFSLGSLQIGNIKYTFVLHFLGLVDILI